MTVMLVCTCRSSLMYWLKKVATGCHSKNAPRAGSYRRATHCGSRSSQPRGCVATAAGQPAVADMVVHVSLAGAR